MMETYPHWIYDNSEIDDPLGYGERAVKFLCALKHPKSSNPKQAFQLDPWQERIVRKIYGPRHEDGTRIVKTVFLLLPRGNRKTSLAAALALLHTVGPEKVPGGEVLSAAADRKQARLGFTEATGIITQDNRIEKFIHFQEFKNRLTFTKNGSFYEAISADSATQHGRTPIFVLADELHAWKKRDLWDVLDSGLIKVSGSLCVIATTAGRGQENIAFEQYNYAHDVAIGKIKDPAYLPVLFEAPKDCDWRDEEIWYQVNPGLKHGYPDIEGLRRRAREAENKPGSRESFRQLHLNIWLDHSTDPFIDMDIYDKGDIASEGLENQPCWIGVDLSTTTDLTAVIACVRLGDEFHLISNFFCPADDIRTKSTQDGVPYVQWEKDGFINATPGAAIDYRAVESCIRDLCDRYDVKEIGFDPHYAYQIQTSLMDDGYPVINIRQGWVTQSPALNELERVILERKLHHGGHPVLRWCFECVAIKTDTIGNRKMGKSKKTDRIDGATASWMAVSRAVAGEDNLSVYSDRNGEAGSSIFF